MQGIKGKRYVSALIFKSRYMNFLRNLMLIGSLGRVWSRTRRARNIYQSISIIAYFKLMSDWEESINAPTVEPQIRPYQPNQELPQKRPLAKVTRRQKMKETMRNINSVIDGY